MNLEFQEISPSTIGVDKIEYMYQYNNVDYKIIFWDTAGRERFRSITFNTCKNSKIILYLFNLSKTNDIDEICIDEIRENILYTKIYLIGNKLDLTRDNIGYYRKQAKILIDRGKIHKYFEVSAKTGERIDTLKKNIEMDSTMIKENYEPKKNLLIRPSNSIKKINNLDKLSRYLSI